ncbi:MAG: M20/M25/M40 family metallo-hydrolase, partial [Lachnospiraceae bacterium]|nr:M20/M25/M40 family metallo-hydrolase [Lachnospiraceae bacterium]
MIGYILGGIGAVVLILLAVIIIRTLAFRPEKLPEIKAEPLSFNEDKIVKDMVDMIRCKTISNRDESLVDRAEFAKFEALLKERFPLIHEKCKFEKVGKTGLLYFLKGKTADKPSVCMAHYDVVPVEEEGWTKPAFDGLIEDGCIWGRGTLDTKGTLC